MREKLKFKRGTNCGGVEILSKMIQWSVGGILLCKYSKGRHNMQPYIFYWRVVEPATNFSKREGLRGSQF